VERAVPVRSLSREEILPEIRRLDLLVLGRETRRILGEYELTAEDVLTARKHDDVIARCTYPIDIHNPTGTGTVLRRLPPGEAYDIPLRALIPQQVEHLLVAGR
jgi:hypothetical protein